VTDAERERLAQALGRHYAEDRIDAGELSRRLDLVYGDAPEGTLDGLPPLTTHVPEKRRRLWGRRHGEADRPKLGWVPTKERFVDPSTGRVMRVWVDAGSHTRHYVPD
jgi:Domain of unknown function (DUF1707)